MTIATLPKTPQDVREQIRHGQWRGGNVGGRPPATFRPTWPFCRGIWPFDFLLFCQRNPKPCPLLEVVEAGQVEPGLTTPGGDIRSDVPGYRIYENGEFTAEVDSLVSHWRDDLVSFLLGCSFSFETAMTDAGIPLRHQEMGTNVSMYITNIATNPAGQFSGPMVVSMRPHQKGPDRAGGAGHVKVSGHSRRAGPHR